MRFKELESCEQAFNHGGSIHYREYQGGHSESVYYSTKDEIVTELAKELDNKKEELRTALSIKRNYQEIIEKLNTRVYNQKEELDNWWSNLLRWVNR